MEVRLDSPQRFKAIRTDDGRLVCEGAFCRDGILEYRRADGSVVRELRRPEINSDPKTVNGFKLLPMVVEHPPSGLLSSKNYRQFAVGMTDSSAHYDSSFGGILGLVSMFDGEAISLAESGEKVELSAGYGCDIIDQPGVWNGQRYDREQINIRPNHLALTAKGRAGSEVGLRLDSENGIGIALESPGVSDSAISGGKKMARVVCDSVEYDGIPEVFASVAGQKIAERDQLLYRVDSLQAEIEALRSQLEDVEEDRMRLQGRCDGLEIIVDNADLVTDSLGYYRNDDGQYVRRYDEGEDEYEDEDEDKEEDEDDREDGNMKMMKKKKHKMKEPEEMEEEYGDEEEERGDSVSDRLATWKQCDLLWPGFSDQHFDSSLTSAEVKGLFIESIDPEIDLSNVRSDSYIDGVFGFVVSELAGGGETRTDSSVELDRVMGAQRNDSYNYGTSYEEDELYDFERQQTQKYKEPLLFSKQR